MFTTMAHTSSHADRAGAEWGPAKHDPEHPLHRPELHHAGDTRVGTALRDADDRRPDDN